MKNYERFISVFGQKKYEEFLEMAKDNAPMLRWFLEDEEKTNEQVTVKPALVAVEATEEVVKPGRRKAGYRLSKVNYDWYIDQIENFYLSGERSKDIKLKDDQSRRPAKTLATLRDRFLKATDIIGLNGTVVVRKYYQGTVNECVTLENLEVSRNPVITYKLG